MNEEEKHLEEDLKSIKDFEAMIHSQQQEAVFDLNATDLNSIKILLKLARHSREYEADDLGKEEESAIRHLEKRVIEVTENS